jgi:hypothetical protein
MFSYKVLIKSAYLQIGWTILDFGNEREKKKKQN